MLHPSLLLPENWQLCVVKLNKIDAEKELRDKINRGLIETPEDVDLDECVNGWVNLHIRDPVNIEYFMVPANMNHDDEDKFIALCEERGLSNRTYFLETPEDIHWWVSWVYWYSYNKESGWERLEREELKVIARPVDDMFD